MTIGLSIWVLVDSPSFAHFLDVVHVDDVPVYRTGAALLLAVACVVFLLTLFGCVGASRESKCMLGTVRIPSLGLSVQGSAKRWSPGCVNAAGKARQK